MIISLMTDMLRYVPKTQMQEGGHVLRVGHAESSLF